MIARGELTKRVQVYGGVGMCFGMRPEYVRVGLQYPNFKMIWFPTFTSYGFWRGDEMKQLRDLGVYVGTYCQPMIPSLYQPVADPMETIRTIKEIGPDRCIIGSDFGQVLHMDAIDGMRVFIRALLGFGIKPDEVKVMLKDNPAKLMWLEQ